MTKPVLAPAFCQVAWVVRDLAAAPLCQASCRLDLPGF